MSRFLTSGVVFSLIAGSTVPLRCQAASEAVIYSFSGGTDGARPTGNLVYANDTLIGTTYAGGGVGCSAAGCGTIFEINLSGDESVVYAFNGGAGGAQPYFANVINIGGVLYGTTSIGGKYNNGTVFAIASNGTSKILHSFGEKGDGTKPEAGLIEVAGALYGTTSSGGAEGSGAVFKITTAGAEKVIHSFGVNLDGRQPQAGLIKVGEQLYGTTAEGGQNGLGTVYKITTAGVEQVIHSFGGTGDGEIPWAQLINVGGSLYGTTYVGGTNNDGTVFKVASDGTETVIYSFKGDTDGTFPFSSLAYSGGKLFGTTLYGGRNLCNNGGDGCGTVFEVTLSGAHKVIYSFLGGVDASNPTGSLINLGGVFFGVSDLGGAAGVGALYKVTP